MPRPPANASLERRIAALEERFAKLEYAPGMPGQLRTQFEFWKRSPPSAIITYRGAEE